MPNTRKKPDGGSGRDLLFLRADEAGDRLHRDAAAERERIVGRAAAPAVVTLRRQVERLEVGLGVLEQGVHLARQLRLVQRDSVEAVLVLQDFEYLPGVPAGAFALEDVVDRVDRVAARL